MSHFFSRLNYSFGNEDWNTESQALQIKPDDHVFCITASGDRPLHLLLEGCKHITALDANPVQNYLFDLKCAALRTFDYDTYIGFLGGSPRDDRDILFRQLLDQLDPEAARFWFNHPKMIRKGALYQGSVERLTYNVAVLTRLLRPKKVEKLFAFKDLAEQREFVHNEWDTFFMRNIFSIGLSRTLMNIFAVDPGLRSYVDPNISLGTYIYERMLNSLSHCLAKDNLLVSLLFRGFIEKSAFPPYLQQESSQIIKQRLDRVSYVTQDVVSYLAKAPSYSIDCFSFSDVASYISQEEFNRVLHDIYRTAKPGARFCIRQFSSNHTMPSELKAHFQRDTELEQTLEGQDRCFVYRFIVGTIDKTPCLSKEGEIHRAKTLAQTHNH